MKKVWIINQYITTPEIEGDGYRHYYIAKHLKEQRSKFKLFLITSSFAHAPYRHNKFRGLYKYVNKGIPTLILKGNKYGDSDGFGRMINWIVYCVVLCILPFISRRKLPKPDIIVLSSIPLLPIVNIVFFKLLYPRCKFIFEIRDIWPLSAIELGNYSEKNFFIKVLQYLEKLAYKKADLIISVVPKADIHIREVLGHDHFVFRWITNGFEIPGNKGSIGEASSKNEFDFPADTFKIGYAGSLVLANPLDTVIRVVGDLEAKNIHLYILGDGPERKRYEKLSEGFKNIHFLGRVPKIMVDEFNAKMDVLFMGKGTNRTNLYNYGTSQLKTFDYFYAKKPIIQALSSDENPVTYARAGYVVPPEDEHMMREKIEYFQNLSEDERAAYGIRGYDYLLANCTYDHITALYESAFKTVLSA
ncbi:MAG TPA: glycosyltransferase family 4 protein [Eudoraea sp.]|nr:glycosyltransferase family 4 protein [Eudoraea sp.]